MKFKVGDKVRVKKDLVGGTTYDGLYFSFCMKDFCGKEFIVEKVKDNTHNYLLNDGEGFAYNDRMLEPVENIMPEKLVIYRDNDKTIAKYYKGDKTATAEAKCAPEDEFSFEYGAKLAMDRAIEKMKEEEIGYSLVKCVGYRQNYEFDFTVDKEYKIYNNGKITNDTGYTYLSKETKEDMLSFLGESYLFEEVN